MLRLIHAHSLLLAVGGILLATAPAGAQQPGNTYPLVYGATGRPYGPTQAEYQYQRRYGRTWHGRSGGVNYYSAQNTAGFVVDPFVGVYGAHDMLYYGLTTPLWMTPNVVYSGPVYPQFGFYGNLGYAPGVPTINHVPFQGVTGQTMIGSGFQPAPVFEGANLVNRPGPIAPVIERSTPEQQERALRFRVLGDEAFVKTDYREAGERYHQATKAAPDWADPRFRLALSLAARSRFDEAVEQLKVATELDMDWPTTSGVSLDEMYGILDPEDRQKRDEKNRVKTRVAEWTNRDVRDPNRLFLLAALMTLDGDHRAQGLLETAIRLNGVERHLIAFLNPHVEGAREGGIDPVAAPEFDRQRGGQPAAGRVIEPVNRQPGFVPPLPEPQQNRGEMLGSDRERRVFERASNPGQENPSVPQDEIPALPAELLKELNPDDANSSPENSPTPAPAANGPALPPRP